MPLFVLMKQVRIEALSIKFNLYLRDHNIRDGKNLPFFHLYLYIQEITALPVIISFPSDLPKQQT